MGGVNCDGGHWGGGQAADQSGSWSVDREDLWTWIAEALCVRRRRQGMGLCACTRGQVVKRAEATFASLSVAVRVWVSAVTAGTVNAQ